MDAVAFFGMEPTADPRHWRLPVVPSLCSGLGALFGGAGLGACVEALEQATGRPLVWATGQYLSYAATPRHPRRPGDRGRPRAPGLPGSRGRHGRRRRDPDRERGVGTAGQPALRIVGGDADGSVAARVSAASGDGSSRGHDHGPHRHAPGRRPHVRRARRHARIGPVRALGPPPRAGRPQPRDALDRRRLRPVRHLAGARPTGRWQQPRQHAAGREPCPDRVDPRRHPGAHDRGRVRSRSRAPLDRRRSSAGHCEPVDHRAQLARSAPDMERRTTDAGGAHG